MDTYVKWWNSNLIHTVVEEAKTEKVLKTPLLYRKEYWYKSSKCPGELSPPMKNKNKNFQ